MDNQACIGWWKQFFIRAEMEGLRMTITESSIMGSGIDVAGSFTFDGVLSEDGSLIMKKQYLGKHAVMYRGQYNGKDRLWGTWELQGMQGPWEIQTQGAEAEGQVEEERETLAAPAQTPGLGRKFI